jgi:predicted RNase H-like HicB family nuclease
MKSESWTQFNPFFHSLKDLGTPNILLMLLIDVHFKSCYSQFIITERYTRAEKVFYQEYGMKYRVKLKKTEEGYAVWCPGLPGCWSQGETEEEALENIKDAIETYISVVEELTKDEITRLVEVSD